MSLKQVAAEDKDDMGLIETYSNYYMPTKLKVIACTMCYYIGLQVWLLVTL